MINKDVLINQLDEWIELSDLQAKLFAIEKMEMSEISSIAMSMAYKLVKDFVNEELEMKSKPEPKINYKTL